MIAWDVIVQIAQVLAVIIALSPLIQGIIPQFQERVQRGRGRGIFQPNRGPWKLFHQQSGFGTTGSTG